MRKKRYYMIYLTLLMWVPSVFAYQTVPLKVLPSTQGERGTPKVWLPLGLVESYADFHQHFDITAFATFEEAEVNPALRLGTNVADPTMPLTFTPTAVIADQDPAVVKKTLDKSKFKLSQILIASTHRNTIINDQLVKEGDKILEATVVSIQATKVILKDASGTPFELSFSEKPIRGIGKHMDDAHDDTKQTQ